MTGAPSTSAPVLVTPEQLRQAHYYGIAAAYDAAIDQATQDGRLPRLATMRSSTVEDPNRPRYTGLITWYATNGTQVRFAVNNDHAGAYGRLLLGDGDINQGEGIIASWTIAWSSMSKTFTVSGSSRQWPGGYLDGDHQPLRYDLPDFTIDGRLYRVTGLDEEPPTAGSSGHPTAGFTEHVIRRINHWLTHPAPAVPANPSSTV